VIAAWVSYAVWGGLFGVVLTTEFVALFTEHRTGLLPLTRVVRDRLMPRSRLARTALLLFLAWLPYHFFLEGPVTK
jgi:hypothetical protein